jgi:hypothetical protein
MATDARENPHWGTAGVPFMKRTTGVDETAFCIRERALSERNRANDRVWDRMSNGVVREDRS